MSTDTASLDPRRPRKFAYMVQDCPLTLREGLAEYYTQIDDLITDENAPSEVALLFHYHDICHVVFGVDTSIPGEMLADTWVMSGTTEPLTGYLAYLNHPKTREVVSQYLTFTAFWKATLSLPAVANALWVAFRMPKKWPYRDNLSLHDTPLATLRADYHIRVVHPPAF